MGDNFDFTPGAGATGAAQEEGGILYPEVKLTASGTGTTEALTKAEDSVHGSGEHGIMALAVRNDVLAALAGADGDYSALQVDADGALYVLDSNSAAIKAAVEATQTAVELIDNAIAGSEMQVDIVADGAGLATDAKLDTLITDTNAMVVDLAALEVDLAAIEVLLGTIDTDTGAMVTDLAAIEALLTTIDVDTGLASVYLGNIDADTGAIKTATEAGQTALEIMDDWDAVHDSAASSDGPQVMAAYDSTKPAAVADGDAVRILADAHGRLLPGVEPERAKAIYDSANATAEGCTVIAAPGAGLKLYVTSMIISSDIEGWIKLQDEDSNALTGKMWLKAGGGTSITFPPNTPLVLDVANKALEVIAEAVGDVSVTLTYYPAP